MPRGVVGRDDDDDDDDDDDTMMEDGVNMKASTVAVSAATTRIGATGMKDTMMWCLSRRSCYCSILLLWQRRDVGDGAGQTKNDWGKTDAWDAKGSLEIAIISS